MIKFWGRSVFALLVLSVGACSSIVEGSTQTITVVTDPPGANCTLNRAGQVIGVANPTPASVVIDKSKNDISVLCEMDEHFDGASSVESEFAGATLGNILLGGGIGVAIDAASGAMNKYPTSVTVAMVPKSFTDTVARDAFFDRQIARVSDDAAAELKKIDSECDSQTQSCDSLRDAVQADEAAEIDRYEAMRTSAVVQ